MNLKFILYFITILALFFSFVHARNHNYKISGTILYSVDGGDKYEPWADTELGLYDKDGSFNCDDLLGDKKTDERGNFVISGSEDEEETPEPYLYFGYGIWHVKVFLEQEVEEQTVTVYLEGPKNGAIINGHSVGIEYKSGPILSQFFCWGK